MVNELVEKALFIAHSPLPIALCTAKSLYFAAKDCPYEL